MVPLLLDLQRATHVTLHHLTTVLADLRLSPSELNALANLAVFPDGAGTVSELGAAAGVRPTTLTGIVDRLEQRDLLTREPHARDRRTVVLRLTPAGTTAATRVLDAMTSLERRALSSLPSSAAADFAVVLQALSDGAA
ncbi:MarR family winged helix-turn-helix transcriptional regulator [Dactylosporangium sp. NPDC051541]|uniref:MarR family winged helix-turn-helix transcriptional regulator n=1 Tax=Dactylosporangium sp. NPDC051541 TaxID=3363977 RepID=UPI00378D887A